MLSTHDETTNHDPGSTKPLSLSTKVESHWNRAHYKFMENCYGNEQIKLILHIHNAITQVKTDCIHVHVIITIIELITVHTR